MSDEIKFSPCSHPDLGQDYCWTCQMPITENGEHNIVELRDDGDGYDIICRDYAELLPGTASTAIITGIK